MGGPDYNAGEYSYSDEPETLSYVEIPYGDYKLCGRFKFVEYNDDAGVSVYYSEPPDYKYEPPKKTILSRLISFVRSCLFLPVIALAPGFFLGCGGSSGGMDTINNSRENHTDSGPSCFCEVPGCFAHELIRSGLESFVEPRPPECIGCEVVRVCSDELREEEVKNLLIFNCLAGGPCESEA